jgi:hypothetical protein
MLCCAARSDSDDDRGRDGGWRGVEYGAMTLAEPREQVSDRKSWPCSLQVDLSRSVVSLPARDASRWEHKFYGLVEVK